MRERIRHLLRWLDARLVGDGETFPVYHSTDGSVVRTGRGRRTGQVIVSNFIETGPPAFVAEKERFRLAVLRGTQDTSGGFWLDAQFLSLADDEWRPLLMFHESKLPVILAALREVEDFLAESRVKEEWKAAFALGKARKEFLGEPSYHGEVVTASAARSEVLSIDVLDGHPASGQRYVIRLALDTDDEHQSWPTFRDLSSDDARKLATHLLRAADVTETAGARAQAD